MRLWVRLAPPREAEKPPAKPAQIKTRSEADFEAGKLWGYGAVRRQSVTHPSRFRLHHAYERSAGASVIRQHGRHGPGKGDFCFVGRKSELTLPVAAIFHRPPVHVASGTRPNESNSVGI